MDGIYGQRFDADGTPAEIVYRGTTVTITQQRQAPAIFWLISGTVLTDNPRQNDSVIARNTESVDMGGGDDVVTLSDGVMSPQVSKITLSGDVKDLYTLTIDDQEVSYTSGDTLSDVRAGLTGAINATEELNAKVVASQGDAGEELLLTATTWMSSSFSTPIRHTTSKTRQRQPGQRLSVTTWDLIIRMASTRASMVRFIMPMGSPLVASSRSIPRIITRDIRKWPR